VVWNRQADIKDDLLRSTQKKRELGAVKRIRSARKMKELEERSAKGEEARKRRVAFVASRRKEKKQKLEIEA